MSDPSDRRNKLQLLIDAQVLTQDGARELGQRGVAALDRLDPGQVQTLIDVANKVGRNPNCWLI